MPTLAYHREKKNETFETYIISSPKTSSINDNAKDVFRNAYAWEILAFFLVKALISGNATKRQLFPHNKL
jgi:hypothetical protein